MIRKWAEDIKVKTRDMDRDAKVEYVMNYYWYHILLGALMMALFILCIYHVTWGRKKTDFSMVIVNQEINFARDEELGDAFAEFSGLSAKHVQVDSDYMISYGDVKLQGINESSFEKFFFSWSAGSVDAVVMPESFYRYCKEQNGTFVKLGDLLKAAGADIQAGLFTEAEGPHRDIFLKEDGACVGVYVDKTALSEYFIHDGQDPYVLVFPTDMKHAGAAGKFLEYTLGTVPKSFITGRLGGQS